MRKQRQSFNREFKLEAMPFLEQDGDCQLGRRRKKMPG